MSTPERPDPAITDIVVSKPDAVPTVGVSTDTGVSTPLRPRHGRGTGKDLVISLSVLVIPLLVVVAWCTPHGEDKAPTVDPSRVYAAARAENAFTVREPEGLDGWRPTVANFDRAAGGRFTARVSYSTPDGHYLQLVQGNSAADSLIAGIVDKGQPLGTEQLPGGEWTRYTARDGKENAYVLILKDVTVIVVGDAGPDRARQLIRSLRP